MLIRLTFCRDSNCYKPVKQIVNFMIMKKTIYYLTALLLFAISNTTAQTAISANGGTATAAGTEVSWTIGEPIIATVSDGTTTLTQGFHQTKITVTAVNDIQDTGIEIEVYPNPTSDFVTIHFNKLIDKPTYSLFDFNGKIIEQKNILGNDIKVNMTNCAEGSYLLRISHKKKQPLQTFKVIKH